MASKNASLRQYLATAEAERAEQWRLRREAEGSRDAARAAADSLRMDRDDLASVLRDIRDTYRPVTHPMRRIINEALARAALLARKEGGRK